MGSFAKRVFALDLERCPRCQSGALRMIAALTSRPVIRRILRHLKRAADPPPLAPARLGQGRFAWVSASINALGPGFRVPSQAEVRPLGPMLVIASRAESLRGVFEGRMGPPLTSPQVDQGPELA